MTKKLVLASASPRRRELLRNAGIDFSVRPAHIEEVRQPDETAKKYVARLAEEKALAIEIAPDEIVLAADTTVEVASEILEKPRDSADARRMLQLLSGRPHFVHTGIYLKTLDWSGGEVVTTTVHFANIPAAEIDAYVLSGEPMDKAGAYAIQGLASRYVEKIDGCYFNVVGLPVSRVWKLLTRFRS